MELVRTEERDGQPWYVVAFTREEVLTTIAGIEALLAVAELYWDNSVIGNQWIDPVHGEQLVRRLRKHLFAQTEPVEIAFPWKAVNIDDDGPPTILSFHDLYGIIGWLRFGRRHIFKLGYPDGVTENAIYDIHKSSLCTMRNLMATRDFTRKEVQQTGDA